MKIEKYFSLWYYFIKIFKNYIMTLWEFWWWEAFWSNESSNAFWEAFEPFDYYSETWRKDIAKCTLRTAWTSKHIYECYLNDSNFWEWPEWDWERRRAESLCSKYDRECRDAERELSLLQVADTSWTLRWLWFSDSVNTSTESFMEWRRFDREEDENQVTELVANWFNMWLNEEEVWMLVDWSYDEVNINSIQEERREEFIWDIKELDEKWLLDWENEADYEEWALSELLSKLWISLDSNWKFESISFEWYDLENVPEELKPLLETAFRELNNNESDRSTDKYFKETWFWNLRTDSTPWCAAFVNWTLQKSWFEMTWSNAAKSFIEWSWLGHVWFKVWDGLLWWNQSNMVCIKPLNLDKIAWYAMPLKKWETTEDWKKFQIHKKEDPDFDVNNIPDWAIIVYNRSISNSKDKHYW